VSDDEPAFASRQSFAEAWRDLEKQARFRVITLIAQLAFLAVAVLGFFLSLPVITIIGVAGVIAMVVLRLVASIGRIAGPDPLRNRLLDE
jgi:hypothetical protein